MASFSGELRVGGLTFPLHSFRYETTQATDARGRVVEKVRNHFVFLTCDVPEHNFLENWAFTPFKRLAADIVVLDAAGGQALETVSMAAAYCVGYEEWFEVGNTHNGSYRAFLQLSDPDGWTWQKGGPGVFITPAARDHGVPMPSAEAAAAAASLENKKQRYAARMKLLADSDAKLKGEMNARIAALPRPSLAMPTEAGTPVPPLPLPAFKDLSPALAAHERLSLNNMGVEHAKLSDDTYFVDVLKDSNGKLNPIHYLDHTPDGTYLLNNPTEGWKIKEAFKHDESGFLAVLYESTFTGKPQYVLAFRGTDADPRFMDELKEDASTDGMQGIGLDTEAFQQVKNITDATKKLLGETPFTAAGHSLGGAEASLSSLLSGNKAYTFNSGGLHVNTIARAGLSPELAAERAQNIEAFYADNDPLSYYQDRAKLVKQGLKVATDIPLRNVPGLPPLPNPLDPILLSPYSLPQAIGNRHLILSGATGHPKGADIGGHSVGPMVKVIEGQKTADAATLTKYLA